MEEKGWEQGMGRSTSGRKSVQTNHSTTKKFGTNSIINPPSHTHHRLEMLAPTNQTQKQKKITKIEIHECAVKNPLGEKVHLSLVLLTSISY